MGIGEIRGNADDGSTHYYEWWSDLFGEYLYTYLKIENGSIFKLSRGVWEKTTMYDYCEIKPL